MKIQSKVFWFVIGLCDLFIEGIFYVLTALVTLLKEIKMAGTECPKIYR